MSTFHSNRSRPISSSLPNVPTGVHVPNTSFRYSRSHALTPPRRAFRFRPRVHTRARNPSPIPRVSLRMQNGEVDVHQQGPQFSPPPRSNLSFQISVVSSALRRVSTARRPARIVYAAMSRSGEAASQDTLKSTHPPVAAAIEVERNKEDSKGSSPCRIVSPLPCTVLRERPGAVQAPLSTPSGISSLSFGGSFCPPPHSRPCNSSQTLASSLRGSSHSLSSSEEARPSFQPMSSPSRQGDAMLLPAPSTAFLPTSSSLVAPTLPSLVVLPRKRDPNPRLHDLNSRICSLQLALSKRRRRHRLNPRMSSYGGSLSLKFEKPPSISKDSPKRESLSASSRLAARSASSSILQKGLPFFQKSWNHLQNASFKNLSFYRIQQRQNALQGAHFHNSLRICKFFNTHGYCFKENLCPYHHDSERRKICPLFLEGDCFEKKCALRHFASPLPICGKFLQGLCVNDMDCEYRHIYTVEAEETSLSTASSLQPSSQKGSILSMKGMEGMQCKEPPRVVRLRYYCNEENSLIDEGDKQLPFSSTLSHYEEFIPFDMDEEENEEEKDS
ncbi:zinc finger (CCCH type) motif-containing protein [Cardiosporidium cionae]|uniref:Zinc finger (CCCH type) motif-containing protein n=1 Tax=Cardiosporidium cionae TaxID=476202 RepID=A0ABQ7J6D0_9APIC|nr:zinc finger (CCCH type) motif-containing protein [Cardiosporidium cionae]|eukprot:KAF8819532.1 zinc finger (CCCH type) motif-containing protein [Cardiosporidium cionae]